MFTYSERPNTHSLSLKPVIPKQERKKRTHKLRRLSKKKRFEFDSRFENEVRPTLFEESNKEGFMFGWTNNYVRVVIPFNERFINTIQDIELTKISKDGHYFGKLPESVLQEEQTISELIADE